MIAFLLVLGLLSLVFVDYYARTQANRESRIEIAQAEQRIRDEVLDDITEGRALRAAQDAELIAWLMKWTTATRADLQAMTELTEEFRDLAAATFVEGESDDEGKSN